MFWIYTSISLMHITQFQPPEGHLTPWRSVHFELPHDVHPMVSYLISSKEQYLKLPLIRHPKKLGKLSIWGAYKRQLQILGKFEMFFQISIFTSKKISQKFAGICKETLLLRNEANIIGLQQNGWRLSSASAILRTLQNSKTKHRN